MPSSAPGPSFEYINTVTVTDGVATLDLARSSHFRVNVPTTDFTVAVDNIPAGDYVVDLYLRLLFSDPVPTITWPAEFIGHLTVFAADTNYTLHMRTWDSGVAWRPAAAAGSGITRYVDAVGDGASTEIAVTHGLGVSWPIVQLYETATGAGVIPSWSPIGSNQIQLAFDEAPDIDEFTVVIL